MKEKIEKFYREKISKDWQNILDKFNIVDVLSEIKNDFESSSFIQKRNVLSLLRPFYFCNFNDLKLFIVGDDFKTTDITNGCFFDSLKGFNESTLKLIRDMQLICGFDERVFDKSLEPLLSQGVVSTVFSNYKPWYDFIVNLLKFIQNNYEKILYVFIDNQGCKINYEIPVLHFQTKYFVGSRFEEQINNTLEKIGESPIDFRKLIKKELIYDVRRIMLKN